MVPNLQGDWSLGWSPLLCHAQPGSSLSTPLGLGPQPGSSLSHAPAAMCSYRAADMQPSTASEAMAEVPLPEGSLSGPPTQQTLC